MTEQNATLGLLESRALELTHDELSFLGTQPGKVVETGIFTMIIGLVLATVKYHETSIAPTETTVSLVIRITYQAMHASRVEVADLMIAADEEYRPLCSAYGVCQTVNHTHGMIAIVRLGQTIAIKYDEIGRNALLVQRIKQEGISSLVIMQVVEDEAGKVGTVHLGRTELIKRSTQRVARMELIGMLHQKIHNTNAVVVFLSWLQAVQRYAVLYVVAHLLPIEQGTLTLQVVRLRSVLHPAMGRGGGLEHYRHLSGLQILQVGLGGHQLFCFQGQAQVGYQGAMVRSIGGADNGLVQRNGRATPERSDVINTNLRVIGRKGGLLTGINNKVFPNLRQFFGVRLRIPVTGDDEGFLPPLCLGYYDGDGCQPVLLHEIQMGTRHHVVLLFYHQEHPRLLARQGNTADAQRTLAHKDAHAILTTLIVDRTGKYGIIEGAAGQFINLMKSLAASGHAVQLLQCNHIRLLPQYDSRRAVVINHIVQTSTMLYIITHNSDLPGHARLVLGLSGQGHNEEHEDKGYSLSDNDVFHNRMRFYWRKFIKIIPDIIIQRNRNPFNEGRIKKKILPLQQETDFSNSKSIMKRALLAVLAYFVITQLITGFATILIAVITGIGMDDGIPIPIMAPVMNIMMVAAILVCWKKLKVIRIPEAFSTGGIRWGWALAAIAACMCGAFATNLMTEIAELPDLIEEAELRLARNIWGIMAVCVVAPIAEELLFREGLCGYLARNGMHPWKTVWISSIIFGLIHANPAQIPFAILLGLMLGIIYMRTGSVVVSSIVHILNNSLAIIMILVMGDAVRDFSLVEWVGGKTIAGSCIIVGFTVCAYILKGPLQTNKKEEEYV